MRVFLGGTCNESDWREFVKEYLTIDFFDPVVSDWNEEARKTELREREECDWCLYVITPKMTGVYAIAEVVDDSNKRAKKTIFCYLVHDDGEAFTEGQIKSLNSVGDLVVRNGGTYLKSLNDVVKFLNSK